LPGIPFTVPFLTLAASAAAAVLPPAIVATFTVFAKLALPAADDVAAAGEGASLSGQLAPAAAEATAALLLPFLEDALLMAESLTPPLLPLIPADPAAAAAAAAAAERPPVALLVAVLFVL
jgi:hypothetical protein